MSGIVRFLLSVIVGLALGISYNAWPVDGGGGGMSISGTPLQALDIMSYVSGMLVGMGLWQIGSVPWSALPQRASTFLASQVHFYQFIAFGGACVAIFVYF